MVKNQQNILLVILCIVVIYCGFSGAIGVSLNLDTLNDEGYLFYCCNRNQQYRSTSTEENYLLDKIYLL